MLECRIFKEFGSFMGGLILKNDPLYMFRDTPWKDEPAPETCPTMKGGEPDGHQTAD